MVKENFSYNLNNFRGIEFIGWTEAAPLHG